MIIRNRKDSCRDHCLPLPVTLILNNSGKPNLISKRLPKSRRALVAGIRKPFCYSLTRQMQISFELLINLMRRKQARHFDMQMARSPSFRLANWQGYLPLKGGKSAVNLPLPLLLLAASRVQLLGENIRRQQSLNQNRFPSLHCNLPSLIVQVRHKIQEKPQWKDIVGHPNPDFLHISLPVLTLLSVESRHQSQ